MKKVVSAVLGGVVLLGANVALAQGSYVGGGFVAATVDLDGDELEPTALYGRFGAQISDVVGAEMRAGFGLSDDTMSASYEDIDAKLELELDRFIGAYVTLTAPVAGNVKPYVVFGYTDVKLSIDVSLTGFGSGSVSESDSSVSYGLGADIKLSDTVSLNGEYMSYYDDEETTITGLSIGAKAAF